MENPLTIKELFRVYLSGECSSAEVERLLQYFDAGADEQLLRSLIAGELDALDRVQEDPSRKGLIDGIYAQIATEIHSGKSREKKVLPLYYKSWFRAAAILILVVGASALFIYVHRPSGTGWLAEGGHGVSRRNGSPTDYTRYITLPDSSVVVLKAGGELICPESFTGPAREVTLKGEAYFDVRPDARKRFVIHTGDLTTTVLGTAFNIKALDNKVTVTVTRGKVQVENTTKVLGVLTPDQQLVYDPGKGIPENQHVKAEETLHWAKNDMSFDGISFDRIAEQMSKRYDIPIVFTNGQTGKCPISATFNGTESLDEVLTVLCTARNARYMKQDGRIVIDGPGCD